MNYIPAIIWIAILSFVLTRHIRVYRQYDQQLKIVREMEAAGGMETGSTLVAINQRVRYTVRIGLAVTGIVIGVLALYGVHKPSFSHNIIYGLFVLGYFYASEIATGYLTIRDERVVSRILEIDQGASDESMKANTEAMNRNTAAMDRQEQGQASRALDASMDSNTVAVDANTDAVLRNTKARGDGA
jgi:hypothetical protein